jgi:hypothetical protein
MADAIMCFSNIIFLPGDSLSARLGARRALLAENVSRVSTGGGATNPSIGAEATCPHEPVRVAGGKKDG